MHLPSVASATDCYNGGKILRTTQHSRFVDIAPRLSAHFASVALRQNVGYAGNVI